MTDAWGSLDIEVVSPSTFSSADRGRNSDAWLGSSQQATAAMGFTATLAISKTPSGRRQSAVKWSSN